MNANRMVKQLAAIAFATVILGEGKVSANDAGTPLELARQLNQAFIDVADKVSPAVVVIRVAYMPSATPLEDEDNPFFEMLPREFRRQLEKQQERQRQEEQKRRESSDEPLLNGQGSGVVIREEGYILTNRHVVDGAEKILVFLRDGSKFSGEVRGVDAQSDLAVIKIDPKGKKLTAARLGDSEKTRVGEFAIAIGAPLELDYSVTFGHVSAKGRSQIIGGREGLTMDQDFIQTDANINPGNSGGPLVNIEGEIIGINTLIRGMRTGIGFAVPANLAREVSDKLISEGKFVRAYLGVKIRAFKDNNEYREAITDVDDGVVIYEIPAGGPASKSDLKPGDVITAVDGRTVSTPQQLKNEIRGKKIGAPVTLDVHRFGKNMKVKVNPEAWPDDLMPVTTRRTAAPEAKEKKLGLTVQSLTTELAKEFGVDKIEGVIVTEVENGSLAGKKGIRPGDVITEVNHKEVATPREFREAVKAGDLKKGIILNYISRGTSRFEILKESGD
jgi:serine protease Do